MNDNGAMPQAQATQSLMHRLREATKTLHDATEAHSYQSALAQARLPREVYAAHLAQLYLIHCELERHLRKARETDDTMRNLVEDHQFKEQLLVADLRFFGIDPASLKPLQATLVLLDKLDTAAASATRALLGFHYVLEGSTNGARFLAKVLGKAYGLKPTEGLSYLDPYGDRQRELWQQFKNRMDQARLPEAHQSTIVESAHEMFQAIMKIGDEVLAGFGLDGREHLESDTDTRVGQMSV